MQRKIRLNILFFISLSFILIFSVKTLSAQEKIELALDECIKMALDNNRNLQNASNNKISKSFDRIFKSQSEEKEKNRRNKQTFFQPDERKLSY